MHNATPCWNAKIGQRVGLSLAIIGGTAGRKVLTAFVVRKCVMSN